MLLVSIVVWRVVAGLGTIVSAGSGFFTGGAVPHTGRRGIVEYE